MYSLTDSRSDRTSRFYGLNRYENGREGEFRDMLNMSSDRYPCLSPSRSHREVYTQTRIQAVTAPRADGDMKGFTGIAAGTGGYYFYYNGERIDYESEDMILPRDEKITIVDYNGRIVICAYSELTGSKMYYFGYTASDEKLVKRMEKGVYNVSVTAVSSGEPSSDLNVTNYLTAPKDVDWTDHFNVGDSVCISGFEEHDNEEARLFSNNTVIVESKYEDASDRQIRSAIVERVTSTRLYLQLRNYKNEQLVFRKESASDASVYIGIPTLNHICIHNNRLWGTNPNGEYIYASKLGDCFNWYTYRGLNNDSYYAEIGTSGGFEGIISYRDNLVAFKKDCIHHIYGDKPSNFSIPKQLGDCGCIDIKSAVQIGTALYFLWYDGFYEYMGGQPERISEKLDRRYTGAAGMTDGRKYYVSCKGEENEFLVYDTLYSTWHREEYIDVKGYFRRGGALYMASETAVMEYGGGDYGKWECVSCPIDENNFDNKGMTELWIRARIDEGAHMDIYTREDGGEWINHGRITNEGRTVYRIPVRFITGEYYEYKLEGSGRIVITDIERVYSQGGRRYKG